MPLNRCACRVRRRTGDLYRLRAAVIVVVAAYLGAGGCQTGSERPAFSTTDSWYHPLPVEERPGGARPASYRPLAPSLVALVTEPRQAEADDRLEDVRWVRLTPEDADRLAGWDGAPYHNLFLLRGIEPAGAEGEFRVAQTPDGDVAVTFVGPPVSSTTKPRPAPMRRQAVVAHLDRPPRAVYVTYEPAGP